MSELISYEELPDWVPGRVLLSSDDLAWKHVSLRSYHYSGQDVIVPAMRDFMLVNYNVGVTPMQRRFEGRWREETLCPGACSLLTRAQQAYWNWVEPIDVTHLYLSGALVADVASEMLDCEISEVTLADVLRTDDPIITMTMKTIATEAQFKGVGGSLYVESMARALIIHLLRNYAEVERRFPESQSGLSILQQKLVVEYIHEHLSESLDLNGMASELGMGACAFARAFRKSFNRPPYAYVISCRLERARKLLMEAGLPIKTIAAACGFTDQAHLSRLFRKAYGKPPARFRAAAKNLA